MHLTKPIFLELTKDHPVIPAITDQQHLELALHSANPIVFMLNSSMRLIAEDVERLHRAGKYALIHLDRVDGLSSRPAAVDFLVDEVHADGVISTKEAILAYAMTRGLFTVQRYFTLDSLSVKQMRERIRPETVDCVELIPGIMPEILQDFHMDYPDIVLMAGGLIRRPVHVEAAMMAGCRAVSTTAVSLWSVEADVAER